MEIPNRDELEAELAKRFSRLSVAHRKELLTLLGDPPDYGRVPLSFWSKITTELRGALMPFLTNLFLDAAERLIGTLPIGVDWGLINTRASNWAARYGGELIKNITETTRRAVQEAIAAFFDTGMTRADLEARLARIFSPVRAEMIAITEVTRAAAEGEIEVGQELAKAGILMTAIWNTRNDELVCPICGPLNQQPATGYTEGRRPYWNDNLTVPAHPRCRCFISWELPDGKSDDKRD